MALFNVYSVNPAKIATKEYAALIKSLKHPDIKVEV